MDVGAYLRRIAYSGALAPGAETLRALHVAHLRNVPFENLSIHQGEPIVLADEALFEKIVVRRRGGFCYELNGLFAWLLRALGFDVTMLSAGVMGSSGDFGPEFDHMALMVRLDERWLADVGFGDSFIEPLRLDDRGEQRQASGTFRVDADDAGRFQVVRSRNGETTSQYRFSEAGHRYEDYAAMCAYHQSSPESHFTRQRIVTRATPQGRITLAGMRLIETHGSLRTERELADERDYARILRDAFDLIVSAPNPST